MPYGCFENSAALRLTRNSWSIIDLPIILPIIHGHAATFATIEFLIIEVK